ncbi:MULTISPECIES: nitrite reductase small subunit NirD [unclassified Modestobacter]|uniref:nitrite reductase small subunit NirD n=1 Tax=unclassified Modestobacter TaxID=2643866 RepID=UPI0022AA0E68|nr:MULTISPECIES: nitrite reductase small subunit NirD [unclassified Modestobacter]MCZ2814188.1 nitrite reductase small subunit NirD [Modestobacter sp. VKM Ac-2979]MCZ2844396.1 nitrite reductase small subunit NirD [Modestobacter sp. VKM Ac-2980]MCZ2848787.1 nitrite reductase small subunit NirD [Modestobacter sp. VKM Ac-2978]
MTATLPPDTAVPAPTGWTAVCRYDQLQPERGVAALVDGQQIAVFRLFDGSLHAVGHRDPVSGAYVIARGLVGTRGDAPTVASPMYKQVFDLRTGVCLDAPEDLALRLPVHPVRLRDDWVEIGSGG